MPGDSESGKAHYMTSNFILISRNKANGHELIQGNRLLDSKNRSEKKRVKWPNKRAFNLFRTYQAPKNIQKDNHVSAQNVSYLY